MIEAMQDYYRRRAGIYDRSMGYDREEVVSGLQPVIDHLGSTLSGRDVLEIACGPAFWTSRVFRHARSIVATDFNEETLAEARKKNFESGGVSFLQADAYDLPAFDRVFTGGLAVDWLCHVPMERIGVFLSGFHRRLAAGSVVAFCDQLPKETSLTGCFDDEGNHLQARSLPDGSAHSVIKNYFSEDRLRALLGPCGSEVAWRAFPECGRYVVTYSPLCGGG